MTRDKDYTVSYQNNFDAGNAVIMITGKGNYEGMQEAASFRIHRQDNKVEVIIKGKGDFKGELKKSIKVQ